MSVLHRQHLINIKHKGDNNIARIVMGVHTLKGLNIMLNKFSSFSLNNIDSKNHIVNINSKNTLNG